MSGEWIKTGKKEARKKIRTPGQKTMEKEVLPLYFSWSRVSDYTNMMTSCSE
jgi:hypothetical protein